MTYKEKWNMEHPDKPYQPGNLGPGCVRGYFPNTGLDWPCGLGQKCEDCWDRDIPEETNNVIPICNKLKASEKLRKAMDFLRDTPSIKDSGNRRQFDTGAVRDMQEGKGRCDLMPLEVVREYLTNPIFGYIEDFKKSRNTDKLHSCLMVFADEAYHGCPHTMFLEVAKHFEEGAKKYGENNWQKGIPPKCYIDSAVRHYLKWLRGDKDEPHDRAFVWNLMCCIWEVDYREKEDESK